jgi:hypothetical protein
MAISFLALAMLEIDSTELSKWLIPPQDME